MEKKNTCCFTGHRPEKLPWGTEEEDYRCRVMKARIGSAIEKAYFDGCRHFITGMARGGDFYFAEKVLDFKKQNHPDVTLEAARPCANQTRGWSEEDVRRYQDILDRCDVVTLLQEKYNPGCMMRRNRYMVDHSSHMIAMYNGLPKGGTAQTVQYARRKSVETDILSVD